MNELPEDVVRLFFQSLATGLGLRKVLRLRVVSKLFNAQIMNSIFHADVIQERDIIKCSDRALMTKYFHQRLHHASVKSPPENTIVTILHKAASDFLEISKNKYSRETVLDTLVLLLVDQITVHQEIRYTLYRPEHEWEINESYIPGPNLVTWWPKCVGFLHSTSLHIATVLGDKTLIEQLLLEPLSRRIANGCFIETSLLQTVIRLGSVETIQFYLQSRFRKEVVECIYPREAVSSNRPDILRMILDLPFDFSTGGGYHTLIEACAIACQKNDVDAFRVIYPKVSYPSGIKNFTGLALFYACQGHALDIVRLLFDIYPPLDPNHPFPWWSRTLKVGYPDMRTYPLQSVARWGDLNLVKFLLEHGADPNLGYPVHMAASRGHIRCMQLLIERGAVYNEEPRRHQLVDLMKEGLTDPVKLLLQSGFAPRGSPDREKLVEYAREENLQWIMDLL
ncbi:Hypothetical protein R9X50_00767300 [Acrodontium crateriforme]|uniref:Ankyrin n=1 Tax=Acrodontium crateriforme TaxID=150365 RepID=A0AAQ3MCL9_9PEZI|nr:Hypothetical protein R9X50_00767300 [Acrodontium crateriforme]